jgi:hypothetical protein
MSQLLMSTDSTYFWNITIGDKILWSSFFCHFKKKYVNQALTSSQYSWQFQIIDFSLVKNMIPSTVQKFRILSLASGGLSMSQIALWKPFQYVLLGISNSVVHFSVFNILQWRVWQWQSVTVVDSTDSNKK